MPTKSKEQPAADKSATAKKTQTKSTAQKTTRKTTRKSATRKSTAQKTAQQKTEAKQAPDSLVSEQVLSEQTMLDISQKSAPASTDLSEQAPEKQSTQQSAPPTAEPLTMPSEGTPSETATPLQSQNAALSTQATQHQMPPSSLAASSHRSFSASELTSENIWAANAAIPTLDEATYATQKAQAEAQRRAIEVASLNLQNINDLHELERQSIDAAINAKTNETRTAQLTGAGIDYQTQLEMNGEKSQHLAQAAAKHQAATRETGYADQLIALKDQNFELEIQQAQNVFAEKASRYRAQLTGQ